MSNSGNRKRFFDDEQSEEGSIVLNRGSNKRIRKISPIGFRIVVQVRKEANVSEGGLYLPDGAKQSMDDAVLGEVVEVASARDDHSDEDTNISGIPLGALVLVPKLAGTRVPWDPDLRIVEVKDVLAVVDEVALS